MRVAEVLEEGLIALRPELDASQRLARLHTLVDRRTERYTRLEEAVPFLKELAGPVSVSRKEFNKARRMLGAALLQLRKQTEHGGWGAFRADLAARLDLNEHTLRNCIKVAEKLLTKRGNISPAKVRAAANIHTCVDLNRGELSMGKLEILAGARTPPRRTARCTSRARGRPTCAPTRRARR